MTHADDRLAVDDIRTFVPAKDFACSRSFYTALGWEVIWTDDDTLALLELGGYRFMLQNYYVKKWANNSMLTIVVADAAAWHQHITDVLAGGASDGEYGAARVAPPKVEDWGATVTYAWDPCGVLLHFTQFHEAPAK